MKKYLLPNVGNFYKANLHCHTTYSDGKLTPEEVKKAYLAKGYSIVAFTDHNILLSHNHLSDEKFLALNGMEIDFYEGWNPDFVDKGHTYLTWKGCHLNFIALSPDNVIQPCYNRQNNFVIGTKYKYVDLIKFDESKPDFKKIYSVDGVNAAIKEARDNGFFVTYNHPVWNMETSAEYCAYQGVNAMEICNNGSYTDGLEEYSPYVYDQMLRSGKKIFCIGADDNHNKHPFDSPKCNSFGAFTIIKAEKLEYEAITRAMLNGDFYASQGPEITELYFEDNKVYVKCSDARRITYTAGSRRAQCEYDTDHAVFSVWDEDMYFRITVQGKDGKFANTNAYFIEDLK